MGPSEMMQVADLMRRAADGEGGRLVGQEAVELVRAFPTVYYCFEHPSPRSRSNDSSVCRQTVRLT
jgi:hypothetical protein